MKRNLLLFSLLLTVAFANAQSSGYFTEGFEGDSFPPEGWKIVKVKGKSPWESSLNLPHEGIKSAFSSGSYPYDGINYLITKQFTVSAGDSVTFWFTSRDLTAFSDTLYIQVSTINSSPRTFTTTIGAYERDNIDPNTRTWQRASLSLEAFAGKDVYVAFKHVVTSFGKIYIDDIALGTPPTADIRAISINVPDRLNAGTIITPKATFQNIGSQTQTFNVTLTAGAYSSTKTVTALAPLDSQQVAFDNLTLPSSINNSVIELNAYSALASDVNTKNDTLHRQAIVQANVYASFVNNGWIKAKDIPVAVSGNAVTAYTAGIAPNDTAYIFSLPHNFRFNLRSNKWQQMASNPYPNYYGSAFTYKGKIYYIGGYFNNVEHGQGISIFSGAVSVYDIATNTWTVGATWGGVADYAGCQYHDSLIYVICGEGYGDHDESEYDDNGVLIYNAASNTWSYGGIFPGIASHGLRAGIVNNTIIVVGGFSDDSHDKLSQAYRGDINPNKPEEITWTRIADYPGGATYDMGATGVVNAKTPLVYFTGGVGGFDSMFNYTNKKDTWAYDVNANRWLHGPDKPTGVSNLFGFAPFLFHDTLYIASVGGLKGNDGADPVPANEWLIIGAAADVLPVHLISFTAALQNNKTLLNWKVSEDGLGGYYIIQRAADAVHFADMSEKINAGLASAVKAYTGYDLLPLKGYNYYRLKIINADGSISYSEIKAVNNTAANEAVYAFSIYPNPTRGLLNIVLQNNSGKDAVIGIAVSDAAGRKIVNENKTISVSLRLTYRLKAGVYVVNLLSQDGTWKQIRKVVVE